jgi:hypothetical protein
MEDDVKKTINSVNAVLHKLAQEMDAEAGLTGKVNEPANAPEVNITRKINLNPFYVGSIDGTPHYVILGKYYKIANGGLEEIQIKRPESGVYVVEQENEEEMKNILHSK